jgi:sigma-B regulation protein RsbU (phosphoserine phosphatase)
VPQHRVDRLSVQIDSLQEGFEILSRASNLHELARQFFHILRGNFVTSDINIFFTAQHQQSWEHLSGKSSEAVQYLGEVPPTFTLKGFGGKNPKIAVMQPLVDSSCIGVVLGRKLGGAAHSALDKISLQIFLQLFANAYQAHLQHRKEKGLIFSLNHRLLQLNSLIDTGIEMTGERKLTPQTLALERVASLTNASWGMFTKKVGRRMVEHLVFPDGMKPRRVKNQSHRIRTQFRFRGATFVFELFEKESRQGTIPFDETDQLLLDAIARQVHAVIESQFLHNEELEKQKIERDISVAAAIQKRILPTTLPLIEGYDLFGVNIPTKLVGGDYYDCFPLADGRYALIIADVAGKGIPAALLVSSFHAYLSAYLEGEFSLLTLAQKLNLAIHKASTAERYITGIIGVLNPARGELETINAGHNPLYLHGNDGMVHEFSNGGIAFGMLDMVFPYQSDTIVLQPGERLLLYTDGVTEAMNSDGMQYDTSDTLKKFMLRNRPAAAETFINALMADVAQFTGSAPQSDDITALYLLRQ